MSTVNEEREELVCHKSRSTDKIPPTQDAFLQHILDEQCTNLEYGIWTISTQMQQVVPSPQSFAWSECPLIESWVPIRMMITKVSNACSELTKYSCEGDCTNANDGKPV